MEYSQTVDRETLHEKYNLKQCHKQQQCIKRFYKKFVTLQAEPTAGPEYSQCYC